MLKKRFKIIPAIYLILIRNQKILMLRRYNTGYQDGNYSLVAGHLDGGESFTQGIIREANEEAGIILKPENLKVVHIMHRYQPNKPLEIRERIDTFIQTDHWQGKIQNKEPEKCDDLSWFPLNHLPKNTIPYVKYAIENIQNNIFYSEFGFTLGSDPYHEALL